MKVTKNDIEITKNVLSELMKEVNETKVYDNFVGTLIYIELKTEINYENEIKI